MNPLISVIIPSFNRAGIIERAIKSVLAQDYENWELILIDDGSTDETGKIVLPYLNDPRISYFSQANAGVSSARNHGARVARGEWLIFLDSDDELTADALSQFYGAVSADQGLRVIKAGYEIRSNAGSTIHIPNPTAYHAALSGGFMIARGFFLWLEGYDEKLKFSENTELFHRISIAKEPVQSIKALTLRYHENQEGGSKILSEMNNAIFYILEKHQASLSNQVKRLYHQIMGVNFLRFRNFESARVHLWQAYQFDMMRFNTLGRFLIACLPPLAKRLYKKNL